MTYSLNEVEALSKRAARGAGLPWGLAEDAAKAVRWLEAHNLPGTAQLAGMLSALEGTDRAASAPISLEGRWRSRRGVLCPVTCGATLSDTCATLAQGQQIEMENVLHPLLLLPFAAWAAADMGCVVTLSWGAVRATTDGAVVATIDRDQTLHDATPAFVRCRASATGHIAPSRRATRATPDDASWATLGSFAQRTLAPATEESRIKGAGAGLSDS